MAASAVCTVAAVAAIALAVTPPIDRCLERRAMPEVYPATAGECGDVAVGGAGVGARVVLAIVVVILPRPMHFALRARPSR